MAQPAKKTEARNSLPMKKICFFGDGLAFGLGDADQGGWPNRLWRTESERVHDLQIYNLAVPTQTSADIAARWRREAEPRLAGVARSGLVFCFGLSDMADIDDQGIRVTLFETLAMAEKIITEAKAWRPVLWIGPAPMLRSAEPREEGGHWVAYSPARLAALNEAFGMLAAELGVPYLDLCAALGANRDYRRALIDGDGVHPTADGHAVVAEAVAAWSAWEDWFPRPRPVVKRDPNAFRPLEFRRVSSPQAEDMVATAIL
ncbi:Lysophospholipase L1 [Caenispirillum bisanense]|uniref:Lysophospholipase L1 n=2 Tax=Caenispirillum bisanense TaxID=414052 RepID=A0A286GLK5_9PROT|nr:Lysophospholipase L1 [Caenispirillum bisanense]